MTHFIVRGAAALVLATMLAACGGGGGEPPAATGGEPAPAVSGDPAPPTATAAVPDAAFGSWGAMLAFLKALVADEAGEPLAVPKAVPTEDGAEPSPTS
jgi:hypothetical protein